MDAKIFKEIIQSHYEFCQLAQRPIGKSSTKKSLKEFDIDAYLRLFHGFDSYFYFVSDSTSFKFVRVGGAIEQLCGYTESDLLHKSYSFALRTHRLKDIVRALRGGILYFKYLYKQPLQNRPYVKVNRTLDLKCKDGKYKHILAQSIPILFNDRMEPIYFLNVISDISDIKTDREYTHYILDSSDEKNILKFDLHKHESMALQNLNITKAELRVLALMADGLSSKQIAEKLSLSEHTVKNHRKSMLFKAECSSSSELVKRAIVEGWI